jgi:ligand-binding sensor domain-containing protein
MQYRLLFFLFYIPQIAFAQVKTAELLFKKIDLNDGLSSYNIRKIVHDKYRFTWIATQDGLNRYDGNTIEVFNRSTPDKKKRLLGNDITDVLEDTARNLLWVSTSYGGLNAINLSTKRIEHSINSTYDSGHFKNQWIRCLSLCRGKIWIGSNDGLDVYDPETKKFTVVQDLPFNRSNEIKNLNVDLFYVDDYDRVWVFVSNQGLVI